MMISRSKVLKITRGYRFDDLFSISSLRTSALRSEELQGNAGAAMRYLQRIRDVGSTPEAGILQHQAGDQQEKVGDTSKISGA